MEHDDRRKFHRIDFDGMANLQFPKTNHECCQVKNLSLTGMFVTGNFRLLTTGDCRVKLFHKEKSGNNCLLAFGKIVWSSDRGAGLKFTEMTFGNYMLLQETLISNAEQPEVILREFPTECPFEISGL